MIGALFAHLSPRFGFPLLAGRDREQSPEILPSGDCFPAPVIDGSFLHGPASAPETIGLSPGKCGEFTGRAGSPSCVGARAHG